ncbi:MAG: site-specific tyrosine recombinase XerD [Tannerella sp.]|jgi:integrase/recombinase XerD|nr:site-specific tyrosine recombinase XerD [Tannerella sp.]
MDLRENEFQGKYRTYLSFEKGLSLSTIDAYQRDLDKMFLFFEKEKISPCKATYNDLQQFVAQLFDSGITARSVARVVSGVKSFYRFLLINKCIAADPTELLEAPRIGMKLPDVLSVNEIDAILSTFDLSVQLERRDHTILETLYSCGLRVSELVNLKISDIHFKEKYIKVTGKGSKQRFVPISDRALKEIRNYLKEKKKVEPDKAYSQHIFLNNRGRALTRVRVFQIIKKHAEKAGITKTISPHTFRHSFATHLLDGGANLRAIQAMLGHEKITTTEIYTHIDMRRLRREIIEHHPRNK